MEQMSIVGTRIRDISYTLIPGKVSVAMRKWLWPTFVTQMAGVACGVVTAAL